MGLTAGPTATRKRFDPVFLRGKDLHYLFDLTWAGRTFRISRSNIEVTSTATGEVLQYDGILESEIQWEDALKLFKSSTESNSFPFQVVLPVNVPELLSQGYDLASAKGELSLWVEGSPYEDRKVLLRGRLSDPTYGWKDDPISASLQSEAFEDASLIPGVNDVITDLTWPLASENAFGLAYPFVFGEQPVDPAGGTYLLSQAHLVKSTAGAGAGNEVLLIAGHAVDATSVFIKVKDGGPQESLAVSQATDANGKLVSIINGTALGASGLVFADDSEFFVRWDSGGGGAIARDGSVLGGAGDIITHMLSLTTIEVDWGRTAVAAKFLNQFRLVGVIEEKVSPWEWVKSNLLPILPVTMALGPNGIYPIVWRYWATTSDVVERIDTGIDPGISLEGPVQYEGQLKDIVNSFTLNFTLGFSTGIMRSTLILGGDEDGAGQSMATTRSIQRYGIRASTAESTVVYDFGTAGLILNWWAQAKSLPTRVITYSVGWGRAWLERGMVVSVTDPDLHLTDHIALVDGTTQREDGTILLALRLVEQIDRNLHRTST